MIESAAVFLFFCAAGLASMAPSVTFGDAGEFTASAAVLGVAHAPGYPLQALASRAWAAALPWGSLAYRTNLFSVLCAAGALTLLGAALRRGGASPAARWAALLFLGLCALWRREAGVTEVFPLHMLLLCALLWLMSRGSLWSERSCAAVGLCAGLALANHHTALLAAPAVALQAWHERAQASRRSLLFLIFGLAAGLACYLYLPLRARTTPPLDWGHAVDWPRFLHVLLRRDYGSFSLTTDPTAARGLSAAGIQAWRFLTASAQGLGLPFLLLSLTGLIFWPLERLSRWTVLAWVVMTGPFFLVLGNPPFDAQTSGALERFYLAPWIGLAIFAAAGVEVLWQRVPLAAAAVVALPLGAAAMSPFLLQRGDLAAYDYGRNVLRSLPSGANLYMDGGDDTFYTLAFLRYAQGMRPDLELHDRGGLVFASPYGPDFRRLSRAEKDARRVAVETPEAASGRLYYSTLNDKLLPGFTLVPHGLLRHPVKSPAAQAPLWDVYVSRPPLPDYRSRALGAFYPVMRSAALAAAGQGEAALLELELAWELAPDALWLAPYLSQTLAWLGYEASAKGDWALAERVYLFARRVEKPSAQTALALGLVYERTKRADAAEKLYMEALSLDPKSAKACFALGALYWSQERWAQSAEAFEKAQALQPSPESLRFARQARLRQRLK